MASAAAAAPPTKAAKPLAKEVKEALRLESGCHECYPNDRSACDKEVWNRCCGQEIACHDYYCREEVMGQLQANTKVRVKDDFESDDNEKKLITKGMTGRVIRVDGEGDALIKFWRDEYDDDFLRNWVFKTTFWDKLELPERMVRLRAAKVVKCLDNCTLDMNCGLATLTKSKKKMKAYQACLAGCKVEDCTTNEECKKFYGAYASCKQRTAETGICSPVTEQPPNSEL